MPRLGDTEIVNQIVNQLLASAGTFSATEFARHAGLSRQGAQRHLVRLKRSGVLRRVGRARATRYVPEEAAPAPSLTPEPNVKAWVRVACEAGTTTRDQAIAILQGLERQARVVLDFSGVLEVTDAFADEVFRVWARRHPRVRLEPTDMVPAVAVSIRRARSKP